MLNTDRVDLPRTQHDHRAGCCTYARTQCRAPCHYCGPCQRGCSTGSYFSSQSATLPAAQATGNLTLRPHSNVHSIIYDEETDQATGVRVVDYETKEMHEFYADVIFLCASTLGTAQIMLNSKSNRFPDGIANSSGALGHYLMDHHFQIGASGVIEGFEDKYLQGYRPNGIYIPRFRNISPETKRDDYVRGYGFQGSASRPSWGRALSETGLGADLKRSLQTPGPWEMRLIAFGETLPNYDNHVYLDPDQTDQWGIPLLHTSCQWYDNELNMRKDMLATSVEMLEAAGGKRH